MLRVALDIPPTFRAKALPKISAEPFSPNGATAVRQSPDPIVLPNHARVANAASLVVSDNIRARGFFFSLLLMEVLVFQMSVLPDTLELKSASRILNLGALTVFSVLALKALFQGRTRRASLFFVIPVALVLMGYSANFIRTFGVDHLGIAGILLPWTAALSVPFMRSFSLKKSWALFYRFMLGFSLLSCIEYGAVFAGRLTPTPIVTQNGVFVRGIATMFTELDDGSVWDRMYGVFYEPGTLAMFLIPAIAYALVFAKRWPLLVFLLCLLAAQSIGGYASLVVVVTLFIYWRTPRLSAKLLVFPFVVAGAGYVLADYFVPAYAAKGLSAATREEQVSMFGQNFFNLLREYPLGMPLVAGSTTNLDVHPLYSGSNFALFVAFHLGGFIAFAGYTALVVFSIIASIKYFAKYNPNKNMACAFISLPALAMYVFQRATIFDSALFAFLFAVPIMVVLRENSAGVAAPLAARGYKSGF